ncbi:type II toxin-antitoxin system RelE/ParE family toxin [Phocaeicola sp.]
MNSIVPFYICYIRLIKFIRDGVYEFRVTYGNNEFRIFFIYDGDTIVVLFNAFKKKTQKTPDSEIKKAIKLKEEYYATKGNQ